MVYLCQSANDWRGGVLCGCGGSGMDWLLFLRIKLRALTFWVSLLLFVFFSHHLIAVGATPPSYPGSSFTGRARAAKSHTERGPSLRVPSNSWKQFPQKQKTFARLHEVHRIFPYSLSKRPVPNLRCLPGTKTKDSSSSDNVWTRQEDG